jgi:hypothetical protein
MVVFVDDARDGVCVIDIDEVELDDATSGCKVGSDEIMDVVDLFINGWRSEKFDE